MCGVYILSLANVKAFTSWRSPTPYLKSAVRIRRYLMRSECSKLVKKSSYSIVLEYMPASPIISDALENGILVGMVSGQDIIRLRQDLWDVQGEPQVIGPTLGQGRELH